MQTPADGGKTLIFFVRIAFHSLPSPSKILYIMARVCQVTGKVPVTGNKVSHSNIKTKRRFLPNLQTKRFFLAEEDKWITLKLTTDGIRTINKRGLLTVVKELRAAGTHSTINVGAVSLARAMGAVGVDEPYCRTPVGAVPQDVRHIVRPAGEGGGLPQPAAVSVGSISGATAEGAVRVDEPERRTPVWGRPQDVSNIIRPG